MEEHLVAQIQESLDNYLLDNAVFLAEILVAGFPSESSSHLLASCYLRSKQVGALAFIVLDMAMRVV